MPTFKSDLSGNEFPIEQRISAKTVRHSILDLIRKDNPEFRHDSVLAESELNEYRTKLITEYLTREVGNLSELQKAVVSSVAEHKILTLDEEEDKPTRGEIIADKVAEFGGSWRFIISFAGFLLVWIIFNAFFLLNKGFDPYPFILLNLILSCLAALQAPIIMMSQNRQADKDRRHSKNDYMINLKSELEIRHLHEKLDHFLTEQYEALSELQRKQTEMLESIFNNLNCENPQEFEAN